MELRISCSMVKRKTVFHAPGNIEIRVSSGIMPSKALKLSTWTPTATSKRS